MSCAGTLGILALGWVAIIAIALVIAGVNYFHERWTYRQHQRNLGRIPPRRVNP